MQARFSPSLCCWNTVMYYHHRAALFWWWVVAWRVEMMMMMMQCGVETGKREEREGLQQQLSEDYLLLPISSIEGCSRTMCWIKKMEDHAYYCVWSSVIIISNKQRQRLSHIYESVMLLFRLYVTAPK